MAITFPLDLPDTPSEVQWTYRSIVGVTGSAFTGAQQVFAHQGQLWAAEVVTQQLDRKEAAKWQAFLNKLNGPEGTFLLGDAVRDQPLGSPSGTPVVDGGSQTGNTLDTRGWTASINDLLSPGDLIQVDSGAKARLYEVRTQVDSDSNGLATIDIWPILRDKPPDGTSITTSGARGVFRLAQKESSWRWRSPNLTRINFACVEAIP